MLLLMLILPEYDDERVTESNRVAASTIGLIPIKTTRASIDGQPSQTERSHRVRVRSGDTLGRIFARLGLADGELSALLEADKIEELAARLQPGQALDILIDNDQVLREFIFDARGVERFRFVRSGDTFQSRRDPLPLEKRSDFSSGVVRHSFYQAALNAGLSEPLILKFTEIFQWRIDFALEIQPGDQFTIIYEALYRAGEKAGTGEVLAAEFDHGGKSFRALRYTDPRGKTDYYTPQGQPLRQTFLRSPVDFRRISSHFRAERWHPVLGVRRPHRGVDYAAPTGTPVWASGAGVVETLGRQGGYGNCIVLRHGQRYTTLYGHLSRFRQGLRRGSSVESGEVIGYVGMTGLATGPHLHYEFRIDGRHVDPVTAELPSPEPMSRFQLAHFQAQTADWVAQLDVHQRARLARLDGD
ncbi:MAG: peptidoglycan DD-metalloendopeptidase family protein [Gammaproteobacteria bacterium]|nr:peptidoglycan DD-metalloendopeptidase family protein [Gammaproteobacteria bacterium]